MKKLTAILLSLVLLCCAAAGMAEGAEKQSFGTIRVNGEFTLKGLLPDGYKIVPFELSDEAILSRIISDDPARPIMVLSIAFDETYAQVQRMNDLDDDALAVLEKTFTDTDPYVNITYDETAYGTRLLVARTTGDSYDNLTILSIYDGYFIEFVMMPGKGAAEQKLTDEEVASCYAFLSELDFVEGSEDALDIRGKTFEANITAFNADAKTLDVTLLEPITLTEWQVVSISEGDTIKIGQDEVSIATLAYEGTDAVINDEYYLTRNDDGLYNARFYDETVVQEVQSLTVNVPDSLVFEEGIDPESGEMLEENKALTAADLFEALTAVQDGVVGFDSRNVKITFDENGEPSVIERYYAPWQ